LGTAERRLRRAGHEPLVRHIARYKVLHLMLLPALLWLAVFQYVPIYGVTIAFQDFSLRRGFFASPYVGLKHFEWLFADPLFVRSFANTWIINLGKLALGFVCTVTLALLINEVRQPAVRRTVQTITYLPHFISWVILAGVFNSLFTYETGAVSRFVEAVGLGKHDFLQDNRSFRQFLVVTHVWKEVGWGSIIYLAAMAAINPELYEAARVDGAGRWTQMAAITLPGIASTMVVVFMINLGNVLNWSFDQIYNLYSPLVYESGDIMETWIVRNLSQNPNFSRLAAAGFVRAFIGMAMLVTANSLARRFGRTTIY
jgi:putative aldouronate transport system permease protein